MISEIDGQLHVAGQMNQHTATALLNEGAPMISAADRVFNLRAVEAVDSCALAVLIGWLRTARAAGRRLQIVEAPAALASLASLYGVSELIFAPETGTEASARH